MRFSTRGEYGLRAMVNLAQSYPQKKSLKAISLEENISLKYLERLIGQLRKREIVKSLKGKNGGYVLAKAPEKITIGKIIEVLEGPMISKCYDTHCKNREKCPSSLVWIKLGKQIQKTLYGIKLNELIKR